MLKVMLGAFVALHGLVHIWYVVLAQRLVEYQADMGWTGESWLFSPLLGDTATRALATAMYLLATVAMVGGGIGLAFGTGWWKPVVAAAAVLSTVVIVMFWDGGLDMIVQKGLLGVLINAGIIAVLAATD